MKVIQSYLRFLLVLCLEFLVYVDKLKIFENVYTHNFVKIFFAYKILIVLFFLLAVIAFATNSAKQNTDESIIKAYTTYKTLRFKIFQVISFCTTIGFGIIGCWWFFSISLLSELLSLIFIRQVEERYEKIIEKKPELKKKFEKPIKVKTKLNFLADRK
jgi:hypothetical protein